MDNKEGSFKKIGDYAATLSLVEIGLGSLLHSFKMPFTGQTLSLNQAFILSRAQLKIKQEFPKEKLSSTKISVITSLLKTLSPAGKKLTPMLAISMQGILFNLGTIFFGNNIIGHLIGGILLSLWAFIQPFTLYYLMYGKDLIYMGHYFVRKISKVTPITMDNVITAVLTVVAIKIFLCIVVILISHFMSEKQYEIYLSKMKSFKKDKKEKKQLSPLKGVLKDITRPIFILSIIMAGIFFYFSSGSMTKTVWAMIRPLSVALIIFYIIRTIPLENIVAKLQKSPDSNLSRSFGHALKIIKSL